MRIIETSQSVILKSFAHFIIQILILLSILLLLRGHNYPGGGFIGALFASTGVALWKLAYGSEPHFLVSKNSIILFSGILCLVASMLVATFAQKPILTGIWFKLEVLSSTIKIGTPLIFDVGVYLSVLGSITYLLQCLEDVRHE